MTRVGVMWPTLSRIPVRMELVLQRGGEQDVSV